MNIHEYQAKQILKDNGVKIQNGMVATNPKEAIEVGKKILDEYGCDVLVIKAQIHAGGRGKGKIKETGSKGVVIAKNIDEAIRLYQIAIKSNNVAAKRNMGAIYINSTGKYKNYENHFIMANNLLL